MTETIATKMVPASPDTIREAAATLAAGGLVAFPTETVYGLGADATNDRAVAGLFAAKGRPTFNPLISHVLDIEAARKLAQFGETAQHLAAAFWPGPLTLVLPKSARCPVAELATAGLNSIAIRVPRHPVARALLTEFGKPIVAPSANRSGHVSPTTAQHVLSDLAGRIDLIIDGGPTAVGVESTIVACLDGEITMLRPGGISRDEIAAVLGQPISDAPTIAENDEAPLAPGMLASHYAPRARLRLHASRLEPQEALLAFGSATLPGTKPSAVLNLSERGDLIEAAANLFAHLRALDAQASTIAVMPIPHEGIGEAINDRLTRAAAPRI
ncbi:MAG: L-threonylcarbamoyladenylate synthase [Xanthobacteraceae bacterium]